MSTISYKSLVGLATYVREQCGMPGTATSIQGAADKLKELKREHRAAIQLYAKQAIEISKLQRAYDDQFDISAAYNHELTNTRMILGSVKTERELARAEVHALQSKLRQCGNTARTYARQRDNARAQVTDRNARIERLVEDAI